MTIRDLMPWSRDTNQAPTIFRDRDQDPFMSLHREMNRLVDDMFRGFGSRLPSMLSSAGSGWPSVEISETDKEIRVTAEIPGMEEKDIELLLDDGVLTLRGDDSRIHRSRHCLCGRGKDQLAGRGRRHGQLAIDEAERVIG